MFLLTGPCATYLFSAKVACLDNNSVVQVDCQRHALSFCSRFARCSVEQGSDNRGKDFAQGYAAIGRVR